MSHDTGVTYKKGEITPDLKDIFKQAIPDLKKKYDKPWTHYEIQSLWMGSIVLGQTFYAVHVKEGEHPPYHNYTVRFEINHGKFIMHSVQEGHLSVI